MRIKGKARRWFCCFAAAAMALNGCSSASSTNERETGQEGVVLSAFVQQSISSESGIWDGWAAKRLYEDTNIRVDFAATGNAVEQKLKQYIAAGTLPDIVGFRDADQAQMALDAGLLLPLDDYKEFLPNIFQTPEYVKAVSYSRKYSSNGSGRLYMMPCSIGPAWYNAYNWMPMLQWNAYKQAGMPPIETLEDYLDVVEQMVAEKPETETGEKVYGFSLFSDWDKYSALEIAALSYLYGIDTEYVSPLMETNVITRETNSILNDDSFYKRALHFYFEANQRGLLDTDSRTQSYANLEKKFSEGRVMFSWFSWLSGTYNEIPQGHVNNQENPDGYVNIPASDMKIYEAPDQTIGRNWYFSISKNCKSIEKACELLNWIYDPEVEHYLYNGPEGSVWEYNEDGEPVVTQEGWDIINHKDEDIASLEEGGSFSDGIEPFNALGLQAASIMGDGYTISYRYWPSTLKKDMTLVQAEVNEFFGTETVADYLQQQGMTAKSTIAVNMIPTASDDVKTKVEAIGEVVRSISWEMVYAADEGEFEAYWNSMQEQAKSLGMERVENYYKKAWEEALRKTADYE